ncbi:MAG: LLM class flavin-dependent oxidoreductase, partial [Dehalococcoidia bacterium]
KLVVGVGAGWNVPEHEAFGIPFPSVKERMDRLEEGIEVLLHLWTGEQTSFDGKYYPLMNARALPAPAQRPRPTLLVGGSGEKRTLRIVAKYADEWNAVNQLPEAYRAKLAVLEHHCGAVGRDVTSIRRSMMCAFIIGRDAAETRRRVDGLQQVMPAMAAVPVDQVSGNMRSRGWLVGSPAEVVEQIKALEREGVERIMLQHHNQTDDGVLELIAKEIMPAVAAG